MNELQEALAERAIAAAAWDDAEGRETGDGFFTYRPADETEVVYVGIGGSDGSYQVAGWDADRLRAVAALLLADAQHLENARAVPLGEKVAPGAEEYAAALELLRSPELAESDPYGDLVAARTVVAEYEAANR